MSSPERIEPRAAAIRLADEWNIPYPVAEQIVKGVLLGGQCYVRGRRWIGEPLRDISKEIAAAQAQESGIPGSGMIPWGFTDVEMDWRGLIEHGRPLVPTAYEHNVVAAEARAADMPTLKSNDELRAVEFLAPRLQENPTIKRDDARKMLGTKFPTLGKRGFVERVWPNARVRAGLRAVAPPGPKSKQNPRP